MVKEVSEWKIFGGKPKLEIRLAMVGMKLLCRGGRPISEERIFTSNSVYNVTTKRIIYIDA